MEPYRECRGDVRGARERLQRKERHAPRCACGVRGDAKLDWEFGELLELRAFPWLACGCSAMGPTRQCAPT